MDIQLKEELREPIEETPLGKLEKHVLSECIHKPINEFRRMLRKCVDEPAVRDRKGRGRRLLWSVAAGSSGDRASIIAVDGELGAARAYRLYGACDGAIANGTSGAGSIVHHGMMRGRNGGGSVDRSRTKS